MSESLPFYWAKAFNSGHPRDMLAIHCCPWVRWPGLGQSAVTPEEVSQNSEQCGPVEFSVMMEVFSVSLLSSRTFCNDGNVLYIVQNSSH